MAKKLYKYAVVSGFSRMIYSQHYTQEAAEKACTRLANKWRREHGFIHFGSEPEVHELDIGTMHNKPKN